MGKISNDTYNILLFLRVRKGTAIDSIGRHMCLGVKDYTKLRSKLKRMEASELITSRVENRINWYDITDTGRLKMDEYWK